VKKIYSSVPVTILSKIANIVFQFMFCVNNEIACGGKKWNTILLNKATRKYFKWKVLFSLIIFCYFMTSFKLMKFQQETTLPSGDSTLIHFRQNCCIVNDFYALGTSSIEMYGNPVWRMAIYYHHNKYSTTITIDISFPQQLLWRVLFSGI
jgi:hypothetical protein